MFEEKSQQLDRSLTLFDSLSTLLSFFSVFFAAVVFGKDAFPSVNLDFYSNVAIIPLFLALLLYFLSYFGAYRQPRVASFLSYLWSITKAMITSSSIVLAALFLLEIDYINRNIFIIFTFLNTIFLVFIRYFVIVYFRRSLKKGQNFIHLLIIGSGPRALTITQKLREESEWGLRIVGYLDPTPEYPDAAIDKQMILGNVRDIHKILKQNVVDEVIIAIPRSMIDAVEYIFYACEEEGVRVRLMSDFFDFRVARIRVVELADIPLLTLEPVVQDEVKLITKRCIDLAFTILSMPFVLPIVAIISLAIKLDSQGPIFFNQVRVGHKKRTFKMFKFRSMVQNAEELMHSIEHLNEADGPIFKISDDPRVTRVGHFLRKTSLDELPQLFNVIKGDMSLVGPRPMSTRDVDLFDTGLQRKRFSVKPGLTCYWQISGRSDLPFSKWLELDLKYINNWSLYLDFVILFKTIPAVLFRRGAV